jgi:hypothetical protein
VTGIVEYSPKCTVQPWNERLNLAGEQRYAIEQFSMFLGPLRNSMFQAMNVLVFVGILGLTV